MFATAFTTTPGRCWMTVLDPAPDKTGQPLHCPERASVRGVYRDPTGRQYWVESCTAHAVWLEDAWGIETWPADGEPDGT